MHKLIKNFNIVFLSEKYVITILYMHVNLSSNYRFSGYLLKCLLFETEKGCQYRHATSFFIILFSSLALLKQKSKGKHWKHKYKLKCLRQMG